MITAVDKMMLEHAEFIFICFSLVTLLLHFYSPGKNMVPIILSTIGVVLLVPVVFAILVHSPQPVEFSLIIALLILYGSGLFVLISSAMTSWLASYLTAKRGDKWTKEMDYIYLTMGGVGIMFSVSRIELLTGRFETSDILAPIFLATAVVVRFVKTRAEIAEWNK